VGEPLTTLRFTREFFQSFADRRFTAEDRARILDALERLDANERHPSLRVHALKGNLAGRWSASASDSLRLIFERRPNGEKVVLECTKHYDH